MRLGNGLERPQIKMVPGGGARTTDTRIFNPLLYRLNSLGNFASRHDAFWAFVRQPKCLCNKENRSETPNDCHNLL